MPLQGNKKWQLLVVVACLVGVTMLYGFSRLEVSAFTCPDSIVISPEMLKFADGNTMSMAFNEVVKEFVTHMNYTLGSSQHNATKLSEMMTQLHAMRAELEIASWKLSNMSASAALMLNNTGSKDPNTDPTPPPTTNPEDRKPPDLTNPTDPPTDRPIDPPQTPDSATPTDPPTNPTYPPTDAPTAAPTNPPTDPPTSAPVPQGKQKKRFLVGIATGYQYADRRQAVRDTWVNYLKDRDDFVYKFFLGTTDDATLRQVALNESNLYHDIIFSDDFVDTYYNLTRKTITMMRWASTNYEFQYMLKTDDDSFVRIDKLLEKLSQKPKEKYYSGYNIGPYKPDRNPNSQYYIPRDLYPPERGPNLISGSGYVLSQDNVKFLAEKSKDPSAVILRLEDVNTMAWLETIGVKGVSFPEFRPGHCPCMNSMFLTHWCPPEKIRKFYENSLTGDGTMCRDLRK